MSIGDIDSLLSLVQSQCYLHSLTLPYSVFSHDDIVKLCHAIKCHEGILKIDLTGCRITKMELDVITELLYANKKIQYLALSDNPFSSLDLLHFVKSLQYHEALEELRVDARHQDNFCQEIATKNKLLNVLPGRVVRSSSIVLGFGKIVIVWF